MKDRQNLFLYRIQRYCLGCDSIQGFSWSLWLFLNIQTTQHSLERYVNMVSLQQLYGFCLSFFFFASLKLENKFYLDKRTTTLIPKRFHLKKKSEQCFYFYISARSWSVLSRCGVTALPGGIPHPHPVSTCCVCWWLQLIKWFTSKSGINNTQNTFHKNVYFEVFWG